MQVRLDRPDIQRFIDEQIQAGRFSTPEAVVEDALARMMQVEAALTDEDLAAINLSEQQIDRGEGIDSLDVAARLRRRYAS